MKTGNNPYCTIRDGLKNESSPNISLLFSEGNFQISKQDESDQRYLCSGKNVFLINNVDRFNMGSIRFTRKNKLIYEYKTRQVGE